MGKAFYREVASQSVMRFFALVFFLLPAASAAAGEPDTAAIARYELSLFGYTLGMTLDEATAVRPFHQLQPADHAKFHNDYFGVIDQVVIEDIEMTLRVFFREDRVDKIIGRFRPTDMNEILEHFQKAYGPGNNLSKEIERPNGVLIKHASYAWIFPGARVNLFVTSTNNQFGTASLTKYSSNPVPHKEPTPAVKAQ